MRVERLVARKSRRSADLAAIERLQRQSAARRGVLSLAGGLPAPELFPRRAISSACVSVLSPRDCSALQYGWPEGDPELRRWIAQRLVARGAKLDADDVIITSGAQQAIALAVDVSLTAGDTVRVDAESYPAALELFRGRGLRLSGDDQASAAYVMPGVANPRGTAVAPAELRRLLAAGKTLFADEAYSELSFDGRLPRLLLAQAPDRVFHIGTFSKTICPGFRIGWLVPPRRYRDAVLRAKADADLQANGLSQAIVTETLRTWDYDAHLVRVRQQYARRAERLLRAVRAHFPGFKVDVPAGGFSIFVDTEVEADGTRLLELATREGVSFDPGRLFQREPERQALSFRLCHSNLRGRAIDEAVQRLARAWSRLTREGAKQAEPVPAARGSARLARAM